MSRKAKKGDVLKITTRNGCVYAQISHIDKQFGCLIRVLGGLFNPQQDPPNIAGLPELYQTYIFPQDAHIRSLVEIVSNQPLRDDFQAHPIMRDGVRDPRTGEVATWWLWDGTKEWSIGELPHSIRDLSLRRIWNYKILIDRIEKGWNPRDLI
jgi:hypothetical protein